MSEDDIENALREGLPFMLKTSAGDTFVIKNRSQLAFGDGRAVVLGERGELHVLALINLTQITYLKSSV
jgi:hypothetical protein